MDMAKTPTETRDAQERKTGSIQVNRDRDLDKHTLRFFWQGSMRERRLFLLACLFPLGSLLLAVAVPLYIGKIIGILATPGGDPMQYAPHVVIAAIVGVIANRIGTPSMYKLQANVMAHLQEQAFAGLMRRSIGFHNNNIGGKLVSDALDFPKAYSTLLDSFFTNMLPFLLTLTVGSIIVVIESWQIGIVVALMVSYTVIASYRFTTSRLPVRMRRQVASKAVTSHLGDAIVNVPTVKTFAGEVDEMETHKDLNNTLREMRHEDWSSAARAGNTRIAVTLVMELTFVFILVQLVKQDPSILGIGIFAFSFISMLSVRLFMVNIMVRQIEDALLDAAPMTEILLQEPEIKDIPDATELKVTDGVIDISDVVFRYADANHTDHVFQHLNLKIAAGEKVGLVGPSGGGKSTLTRLLLRFDDLSEGSIAIDGQDISKASQKSLRQSVAYVPQEPLLFHRTIAENIAYGKDEVTLSDIEQAAALAHANEFIESLPNGYDTIVGERGVKLSGGQRQRIAIARAILKDAPILVLDEATSALDSESEAYIQEALLKLMENRTAIVIAHRLSTIQKMDRILVLEDGKITEEGTHQRLLEQHGTYAKLWARQSGGFIED